MRADEKFSVALLRAGFFGIKTNKRILPSFTAHRENLETDNIAHKGNTLYIFEGKKSYLENAVMQLRLRYESAAFSRAELIKKEFLRPFSNIRIFSYSVWSGTIAEYDKKCQKLWSRRFRNLNELIAILKEL